MRRVECLVQVIERRLAGRQRFGVANELEARVDGVADDIRQVVEIEGGDVFRAILQPQGTEGPVQRITFALVVGSILSERSETGAFRQVVPRGDAMGEAWIATLQESNDG